MSTAQMQYAGDPADLAEEPLSIYISRIFRAPRQRVFDAWTRPEMMLKWRGPEGWETLEAESDLRVGGKHRVVVRGTPRPRSEDEKFGVDWKPVEVTGASHGVYLDVDPISLVRFTWIADWAPGEESVITVRLSDAEGGGTLMDFTHDKFLTTQSAQGHNQGWNSAFNKLVKFLEEKS
jgi:uncharacterized protein YndB with AHSA1/START domain